MPIEPEGATCIQKVLLKILQGPLAGNEKSKCYKEAMSLEILLFGTYNYN